MRVAIITDQPFWYEDTMYLNELEKRMPGEGITTKIFVVKGSKFFEKIDSMGIIKFLNITKLLGKLSNFDIIHVQFSYLGFYFAFLASLRLLNKPILIHTHGYDVFTVPNVNYGLRRNSLGKFLTNYTWKRTNRIIAVCKKAKLEIEKSGINSEKINLLYNGIDENLFSKTKAALSNELLTLRENNDFLFLSVASLVPVKNHVRMLKAFERLAEKYQNKLKIKLILVGENKSQYLPNLENPNVIYLGKKNHSQLNQYYNVADAFVLVSLSEAHPWSMLEAMSCELPVIGANVGGIPETIDESRLLMNPWDENDIFKKFESILTMSLGERKKIGVENRQKILDNFTIGKHVNSLKEIYNSL